MSSVFQVPWCWHWAQINETLLETNRPPVAAFQIFALSPPAVPDHSCIRPAYYSISLMSVRNHCTRHTVRKQQNCCFDQKQNRLIQYSHFHTVSNLTCSAVSECLHAEELMCLDFHGMVNFKAITPPKIKKLFNTKE